MKNLMLIVTMFVAIVSHTVPNTASATEPVYTSYFSNVAIKGYDTVAYFTEGAAVEGKKEFSHEYLGATWLFASAENRDLFALAPEEYAPQYGGYCAYAVAQNDTASIQPDQFTIVEGKLYLNYNASINEKWRANRDEYIDLADQYWPSILGE